MLSSGNIIWPGCIKLTYDEHKKPNTRPKNQRDEPQLSPNAHALDLEIEKKQWRLAGLNPEKFDYFFDKYYGRVFEYAYWKTSHHDVANEVTSEVFEIAWNRRQQFRWQGYSFGAWLFQIARGVISNHFRRQQMRAETWYRPEDHDVAVHITPDEDLSTKTDQELVHECLRRLKPEQQEVIVLRYFMGMSLQQVSHATKLPLGTVSSHLTRGKTCLRQELSHHSVDDRFSAAAQKILHQADIVEAKLTLAENETKH